MTFGKTIPILRIFDEAKAREFTPIQCCRALRALDEVFGAS